MSLTVNAARTQNPGEFVLPAGTEPDRVAVGARSGEATSKGSAATATAAVGAHPLADPLTLAGLSACIQETRAAALSRKGPPSDPPSFAALRDRVSASLARLPEPYRSAVGVPLLSLLDRMGPKGLASVLARDPERQGAAALLLDAAQAVLQRGEGYAQRATDALQEVVCDLYDGFVAAEGRLGVKPPEGGTLPPLVRWGSASEGPYTWTVTATAALGLKAGIVSLPAANAGAGLLAWPTLAHETAGHDILEADKGLPDQLARAVSDRLTAEKADPAVVAYWSKRIDEVAADVLGVLNMGPAAVVGLVGYIRALNGAARGTAALRNVGRADDPHPADIARAWVSAEAVRLLAFKGAGAWADRLVAEIDRDLGRVWLGTTEVSARSAKASAAAVARAIVQSRLPALEGRSLGEIQGWTEADEAVVAALRPRLAGGMSASPGRFAEGTYAAHAVAAGVYEAVSGSEQPAQVTQRLIGILDAMHARNPTWTPAAAGERPSRRDHGDRPLSVA